MTNEYAIEQFQNAIDLIKQNGKDWLDERDIPLLDMAIKALKQTDGDLISRKSVLAIIDEHDYGGHLSGRTDFYKQLVEELPSAKESEKTEDTDQKSLEEWTAGEEYRWEGEEENENCN